MHPAAMGVHGFFFFGGDDILFNLIIAHGELLLERRERNMEACVSFGFWEIMCVFGPREPITDKYSF